MNTIRNFQDLRVWQKAHALAVEIYRGTKGFPREETYGLTSQLRRAAVSITANIAEGSKRSTTNDLCHFLAISAGSNEEVKCLLLLARDLNYLHPLLTARLFSEAEAIGAMLNGLVRSLKNS